MNKTCRLIALFSILSCAISAQNNNAKTYQLHTKKAVEPIKVDGVLDEADWQNERTADHFKLFLLYHLGSFPKCPGPSREDTAAAFWGYFEQGGED